MQLLTSYSSYDNKVCIVLQNNIISNKIEKISLGYWDIRPERQAP